MSRRIAFIAFQSSARANGGLASLTEIATRLPRWAPVIFTQVETDLSARWRSVGLHVEIIPSLADWDRMDRVRRFASLMLANAWLGREMRRLEVDIIQTNDLHALWAAGPAAIGRRVPVVHTIRDTLGVQGARWKSCLWLSSRVVVLSADMRTRVLGALLSGSDRYHDDRVVVISSIVDCSRMRAPTCEERSLLRAELGIPPGQIVLLVAGAFMPKKQQVELIEHLVRSPPSDERIHVYFVGDFDPQRDPMSARAADSLARASSAPVRCLGYQSRIDAWYRAADAVLVPSRHEGLARSMIEALACGTPAASFPVCSASEVLASHGVDGIVRQDDFGALVERGAALAAAASPGERARIAAVAGRIFDGDQIASEYERLYEELLSRASATK